MNLTSFQKPSRYINHELNAVRKPFPVNGSEGVRVALAFPDVYEVGMSHLGMKLLYGIINSSPWASAERVFSPWTDLEEYMIRNGVPLSSLETGTPLQAFDMVGFSLQYELSYTTVLNMLHLGGIPLRSAERQGSSRQFPLVIAGGPCTVNPAVMAPFMDAFLIGDGEEAIVEIMETLRQCKLNGESRESLLRELSRIEGVYVPSMHTKGDLIRRRYIADLKRETYPVSPVLPYTSIVHDRINIEVSRGCTRGCRFCQAGMIYRPLRERSPEDVVAIAVESLKNTGYDELSLTSLSAGDYTHLLPVVKELNRRFRGKRVALSLPSLRVAAVNQDVLREIRTTRKTGFTMAPEAATGRLRDVINKDFQEEDYDRALTVLFREGWISLKLYFMIGLPTETDEDVEAIQAMAMKALRIARKEIKKPVNVNITISPFIPKAHTPFQWFGQIAPDEMKRKMRFLRDSLGRRFKYKGHNEEMSLLEAIIARGDEGLAPLIEKAWELGGKLDAWTENFSFSRWQEAMEQTGIDGPAYARKEYGRDDLLPWENIQTGVTKEFLLREYDRALEAGKTRDCRDGCIACGLSCTPGTETGEIAAFADLSGEGPAEEALPQNAKIRVRAEFEKTGALRYLSHLELTTAILRAMRRVEAPLDFSKGFHPSPRVSFGPPLSVGVGGESEWFDMEVFIPFEIEAFRERMNRTLPEGIRINRIGVVPLNAPSLSSFLTRYAYHVRGEGPWTIQDRDLIVQRDNNKEVDITPCV
ncbi:MAG: TIGR03960 family B12-binding radical SAM protein, partial [Thermodesulfovibrionales bacterium]